MYEVGIVGCGVIGERFAAAFDDHDATTVAVACDLHEERAESFAAEYDCRATTDHRELVGDVDVVYVGVPPLAHEEVVADALDAGAHVVCEKPLAADAETGARMVEMAEASDRVTAVDLPFRYTPGFRELCERVDAGEVGDVRRVSLDFRFPRWPREWQDVAWLEGREQGGPLREVGTHFLFGVQELLGPVESVTARVEYAGPDECERSIVGHFEAGGVDGTLDVATGVAAPEENSLTVLGTGGSLSLVEWYRLVADWRTDDERVLNEERESTALALVGELVAELDGDGGDLVSFREANRVQRVVDAVFDSGGAPVSLDGR